MELVLLNLRMHSGVSLYPSLNIVFPTLYIFSIAFNFLELEKNKENTSKKTWKKIDKKVGRDVVNHDAAKHLKEQHLLKLLTFINLDLGQSPSRNCSTPFY